MPHTPDHEEEQLNQPLSGDPAETPETEEATPALTTTDDDVVDTGLLAEREDREVSNLLREARNRGGAGAPLVSVEGQEEVFQVSPEGTLRHITNPEALRALGKDFDDVINTTSAVVDRFERGESIDSIKAEAFREIDLQKSIEKTFSVDELRRDVDDFSTEAFNTIRNLPTLVEDQIDDIRSEHNLTDKSGAITAIDKQIAEFERQNNSIQSSIKNQRVPMGFITGQLKVQSELSELQLQSMYAKRDALVGDYNRAVQQSNSSIQRSIDLADLTFDSMLESLKILKDKADDRKSDSISVMESVIEKEKQRNLERRQDTEAVSNLMLSYPFAGVSPDDDLATAMQKVNQFQTSIEKNVKVENVGGSLVEVETDPRTGETIGTRVLFTPPRSGDDSRGIPSAGFFDIDLERSVDADVQALQESGVTDPAEIYNRLIEEYDVDINTDRTITTGALRRAAGLSAVGEAEAEEETGTERRRSGFTLQLTDRAGGGTVDIPGRLNEEPPIRTIGGN